ncbi:MAG: leucine--tRNA ligase [Candidatus Paceibacterota bacterium]
MKNYDHKKIEPKWRKVWEKKGVNKTQNKNNKPKFYILDMFPYPSGQGLHVGHPRGFVATDIYSRYKRMQGFNVLHPMGWDAFGLPAENYAIKMKVNPMVMDKKNVARYKEQIEILGLNYDWDREINTTDPNYYKWTQWAFLQMYKKGLVYESNEPINWCPSCKTGLANEDLDGTKCERCGTEIEKKPLRQWVIKITNYADRLLNDLNLLKDWPENVKEAQRHWIGRSEGSELWFNVKNSEEKIRVFTTRPDTLFGVTYLVLSPESNLVQKLKPLIKNWKEVEKYIVDLKNKTEIERTAVDKPKNGIQLLGVEAKHPLTKEILPVWIADYVLANYGTGAVMAVPAHDERDFAFAKKYNLPVKQVIAPFFIKSENDQDQVRADKETVARKTAYALVFNKKTNKFLCLDWGKFGWRSGIIGGLEEGESFRDAAIREVKEETGYVNIKLIKELGGEQHNHFFAAHKDINRYGIGQGFLFELIDEHKEEIKEEETKNHNTVWIDADKMEGWLNLEAFKYMWQVYKTGQDCFTGQGKIINSGQFDGLDSEEAKKKITESADGQEKVTYKLKDWVFSRQRYWGEPIPLIHCEKCGVVPVPEKELPLKLPKVKFYEPTGTGESPLAKIDKWVNVKCPKCKGKAKRETNTMPQWAGSSWYYLRYIDPKNKKVLVDKKKEKYWSPIDLYVGGGEHNTRHLIYARFWHKFLYDVGVVNYKEPFIKLRNLGMILGADGRKMSKRWGNVVNPDDVVRDVGADTLRVYESFMGPFDQEIAWSTNNMVGSRRFLEKVWKLQEKITEKNSSDFETLLHKTIKKVTEDILGFNFNTAISAFMILVNLAEKEGTSKKNYEAILKLLSPFAPHMTEEIWANLGHKKSIHLEKWPTFDPKKIVSDMMTIVVQINGKARANFEMPTGSNQNDVETEALKITDVTKWLTDKQIKKKLFIKGRILAIITD